MFFGGLGYGPKAFLGLPYRFDFLSVAQYCCLLGPNIESFLALDNVMDGSTSNAYLAF